MTNSDQDRTVEALAEWVGGYPTMKIEPLPDAEDESVLVSWGEDEGQGVIVWADGTVDTGLGGSHYVEPTPLDLWIKEWNAKVE